MSDTPVVKNSAYSAEQLQHMVSDLLAEAVRQGATAAEAAVSIESGLSVTARMGEVETIEHNLDKGLGVTVYVGQRKGSSSTTDFSSAAIRDAVAAACRIAKYTAEDEYSGLAPAELMATDIPDLELSHPWNITPEMAIEQAIICEAAAREFDPRITNSEGATVSSHQAYRVYGNSHGFVAGYGGSHHGISCAVIGQDGDSMERDYWYTSERRADAMEDAASVGRRAAERTVRRLGARQLGTCQVPVLFSAELAGGLISSYISAIRGGAQYRKSTFLLDSLGEQVFPEFVNIYERPRLVGGNRSAAFDRDGVTTRDQDFARDGRVASYVMDAYAARRLKRETTGNAGGVRNLFVDHGDMDLAVLCKHMDRGLLVTEMMGMGTNGVTGDYSRGAAGFWVENGELQYPVHEITVAGNLKDMFRNIVAIGSDVERRGNVQVGSILVDGMTIAGE